MKLNASILPLVDLVFLALGGLLACMTQMDIVRAIPVEVARVGKGAAISRNDEYEVLSLTSAGLTLNGDIISEQDIPSRLANKRVILQAHRTLPTEETIKVIAVLAKITSEISLEVEEVGRLSGN